MTTTVIHFYYISYYALYNYVMDLLVDFVHVLFNHSFVKTMQDLFIMINEINIRFKLLIC